MTRLLAGTSAAFVLVACDDQDGGLQERVALLQAELDQKSIDIDKARKALAAAEKKEQVADSGPDLDAAKSGYLSGVEDFGKSLAESLPGVKFDRTSVFPVEGPDSDTPIRSKVTYQVTLAGGKSAEITVPLAATAKGDWQFPQAAAIANQFKSDMTSMASRAAAAPTAQPRPAAPAQPPARPAPTDVLNADKTVQVEWNDPASPAPRQPSAPSQAQAPAPAPAPGAASPPPPEIKKVMPTSRDVIIDFED